MAWSSRRRRRARSGQVRAFHGDSTDLGLTVLLAPIGVQAAQEPRLFPVSARRFPASRAVVPCSSAQGNHGQSAGIRPLLAPQRRRPTPGAAAFPCIFPAEQGTRPQRDGFAPDSPHRHLVCGCRDFAAATSDHPRNSRAFAGSWERGTAESEPETASSGPMAARGSRLSLLPSWAVPIRFRFAPQGGRGFPSSVQRRAPSVSLHRPSQECEPCWKASF
jgi:hypothetical protein